MSRATTACARFTSCNSSRTTEENPGTAREKERSNSIAKRDPTQKACSMEQAPSWSRQCSADADQTVEVLQLVLQQLGPGGCDIRTLCSLLQVSTACRAAVYESGVSCSVTATDLGCSQSRADLQRLSGFAAFLPGNAGLVSSLELKALSSETDRALSEHMLTAAVQLCAQQQATASATRAAVQSWTPSGLPRTLRGLQLRSYKGDLLLQPAALAVLGACSRLTSLEWQLDSQSLPAAAAVRSLRHLSTLNSLTIRTRGLRPSDSCSAALAQAFGQLQHLTQLCLLLRCPPLVLQHLPRSLVALRVEVLILKQQQATVSFSHLSCLRGLALASVQGLSQQFALPVSFTQLMFMSNGGISCIPDLPNLRVLDERVDFTQPTLLRHVSGMPVLQKLVVDLGRLKAGVSRAVADTVAAHVASATQITCLRVYRDGVEMRPVEGVRHRSDVSLSLLGSLRCVPRLRELMGSGLRLQADDVLGRSSSVQLSALTSLELKDCRDMTDTAVAALLCKLTGLRRLCLDSCGLSSPVLWPAVAGCSGLHELSLQGNPLTVSDATLLLLTSLRCLTSLQLRDAVQTQTGAAPAVSAAAVQQFRAAMPQLRVLTGL